MKVKINLYLLCVYALKNNNLVIRKEQVVLNVGAASSRDS
jgi:hypothetical protein